MEQEKTIQEIFKDFDNGDKIRNAKILSINLYKKSNKLDIKIKSDNKISINELSNFEDYLKNRFHIDKNEVEIQYTFQIDSNNDVQNEWEYIVNYMEKRFPFTKYIFSQSTLEIFDRNLKINLRVKGKDILQAIGFDNELSRLLLNAFGKKYNISYEEKVSQEDIKSMEDFMKKEEIKAIQQVQSEKPNTILKDELKELPKEQNAISKEQEISPLIYGKVPKIKSELIKVIDISVDTEKVALDGEIIGVDSRELKNGKFLVSFKLYDGSSTILCKVFVSKEQAGNVVSRLQSAKGAKIDGMAKFDPFSKEIGVIAGTIIETSGMKKQKRIDEAEEKRVELHMHTQMSQMDAVTSCADLIKRAVSWGWKSIAITDHGVVQAFPDAHKYLGKSKADIKVIYGVEAYLVPDKDNCVAFPKKQMLNTQYCVLDIETTGLSFRTEKITEIGIMKYKDGKVIEEFECFVNPEKPIPEEVVNITHITDDMVKDAETIDKVLPKVLDFIGDSVLVAHNADFDIGFIKYNCQQLGLSLNNTYIDTLRLAKDLFPDYKKYKLGIIAENLGITS